MEHFIAWGLPAIKDSFIDTNIHLILNTEIVHLANIFNYVRIYFLFNRKNTTYLLTDLFTGWSMTNWKIVDGYLRQKTIDWV